MKIKNTKIKDLVVVERAAITDHRGNFSRWFCAQTLQPFLNDKHIQHINHSHTINSGCIRGMHIQKPPFQEIKIVQCIRGKIFDVAIDMRKNSETFLQWHGEELSPESNTIMIIPEGFAHGFQAQEDSSELLYYNTMTYHPEAEAGIHYADPTIGIQWPLPPIDLSDKDRAIPQLDINFKGFETCTLS